MSDYISKWHKELTIFSKIKPMIILEGNVLDSYCYPDDGGEQKGSVVRLEQYLQYFYGNCGYENIVFYDSLRGFYNNYDPQSVSRFGALTDSRCEGGTLRADFRGGGTAPYAPMLVRRALLQTKEPTVIVMNFASRYIVSAENLVQREVDSFTTLLQASLEARSAGQAPRFLNNMLILVVNKANDVPAWFYLNNPNVKTVTISAPSREEREDFVTDHFRSFFAKEVYEEDHASFDERPEEKKKLIERFVGLTEGFSFTELMGLINLARNEKVRMANLCDVIDLYKYGVRENPWKTLGDEILDAKARFEKRVKGQDAAITKTLDVIKRAFTGLSGLQGSSGTRPKGVLFFAGPTGTGKTETAKTLAQILFGDESRCIRFDMSEYGQSHSDQKLLGAPPGYVGYEAGGQLTNAVKKNPFCILLFDEIEKAHPTILDKFLAILEDGRMTDGQGNTVYFSESIIIFTSNLGIYTLDQYGSRTPNVRSDMPYPEVASRVRAAIEDHFKLTLGRPEILNRIGENIVIFDYIRPPVAKLILDGQVEKIRAFMRTERGIALDLSEKATATLLNEAVGNLENGGRGVGNVVENLLINPLSRYVFDHGVQRGDRIAIVDFDLTVTPPALICEE